MPGALLDTSIVIDAADPAVAGVVAGLPAVAVSCVTLAELAAGPHLTSDRAERARRQARLQQAEALLEPLPFDAGAARSFGMVVAAVAAAGRTQRGRLADLLIAATAHSNGLSLYTRNPADFAGLEDLVLVVAV